jgi:hypothetical protein
MCVATGSVLRGSERYHSNRTSFSSQALCAKEVGRSEFNDPPLSGYTHAFQLIEVLDDSSNAANNAGEGV